MYKNEIPLMPDKPNFPLKPVWVGQGSAAIFRFTGLPLVTGISIQLALIPLEDGEAGIYSGTIENGTGTVYVAGWAFPDAGQSTYEAVLIVAGEDVGDESTGYWCGRGSLNIMAATQSGVTPVPPVVIPADSYAYSPITELYYKITAVVNELGEITLQVAKEGVSHV